MKLIGAHGGKILNFGRFYFWGELGFLNCDDICMCVVNNQFKLFELVLIPCMLICKIIRFLSFILLVLCACMVSGFP